jgi:hypothetical protein
MDQASTHSSLFSLSIDPVAKIQLTEASKWARFLAIAGMVFLGLIVVAGLVVAATASNDITEFDTPGYSPFSAFGPMVAVVYIIVALIGFFPLLYLLRFANKTKAALTSNEQEVLNTSFQNLKAYFRYIGILVIIWMALFVIGTLSAIIGAAAFS